MKDTHAALNDEVTCKSSWAFLAPKAIWSAKVTPSNEALPCEGLSGGGALVGPFASALGLAPLVKGLSAATKSLTCALGDHSSSDDSDKLSHGSGPAMTIHNIQSSDQSSRHKTYQVEDVERHTVMSKFVNAI